MEVKVNGNSLKLVTGDITKQTTEAIVNAANGSLLGGGGVDGAIHTAAGKELLEECRKILEEALKGAYLPTGEAVITNGYNLPARYVIHTVGPIWHENTQNEEALLSNCYQNALQLAMEKEITSISFPSISTGVYRFPIRLASATALQTIVHFLQNYSFSEVVMTLFSPQDYHVYESALQPLIEKH
ncbi:O-acetyl-ADP-ribose deacetylase [Bacillus sp. PK3_68]|uniref:O-acetyl-ADP-ribose deacetylase n=1 Tax=Bacillus sp. PK3_68 TaxID=2027408 RepID=UPI000E715957|nr:O-acetyl-ADP-ribose deacetylase [Bacillus sp. PK3_68]RJS60629.1 O-acetyl-ADP-ribose deacetylase [Bacillus sp. PK3_68]